MILTLMVLKGLDVHKAKQKNICGSGYPNLP
jgi:hypothetical protein